MTTEEMGVTLTLGSKKSSPGHVTRILSCNDSELIFYQLHCRNGKLKNFYYFYYQ